MSNRRPKALDLFCGAGGVAAGLHRAGFDVLGVDIEPQPAYHISGPGTPPEIEFKTFDIEAPALEQFLREPVGQNGSGVSRTAIGIEVVDRPSDDLPY